MLTRHRKKYRTLHSHSHQLEKVIYNLWIAESDQLTHYRKLLNLGENMAYFGQKWRKKVEMLSSHRKKYRTLHSHSHQLEKSDFWKAESDQLTHDRKLLNLGENMAYFGQKWRKKVEMLSSHRKKYRTLHSHSRHLETEKSDL